MTEGGPTSGRFTNAALFENRARFMRGRLIVSLIGVAILCGTITPATKLICSLLVRTTYLIAPSAFIPTEQGVPIIPLPVIGIHDVVQLAFDLLRQLVWVAPPLCLGCMLVWSRKDFVHRLSRRLS